MLVDNHQPTIPFSSPFNGTDIPQEISDLLNADFLNATQTTSPGASGSTDSSSRASSPQSPYSALLTTPPQQAPLASFPEISDFSSSGLPPAPGGGLGAFDFGSMGMGMGGMGGIGGMGGGGMGSFGGAGSLSPSMTFNSFFNLLGGEEALKMPPTDFMTPPVPASAPYDFLSTLSGGGIAPTTTTTTAPIMSVDPSTMSLFAGMTGMGTINPQLVETPSQPSMSEFGDGDADNDMDEDDDEDDDDEEDEEMAPPSKSPKKKGTTDKQQQQKITLTINPVKVGGHGKAGGRKGTVQSGGITKKSSSSSAAANSSSSSGLLSSTSTFASSVFSTGENDKENLSGPKPPMVKKANGEEDDDVPPEWRPPPEVFAKMTSKEKRQLRNKISARNFRVRRKEYITTLEMDIAERDRLLEAIRSELGSTQSENVALRQEIHALKKALLEGRDRTSSITSNTTTAASSSSCKDEAKPLSSDDIPVLNLPPPGPLPPIGAAIAAAASREASPAAVASLSSSSSFVLPNTQKDVSSSLSPKNFWAGSSTSALGLFGMGGGVTPVHTVTSFPEFPSGILGQNVNAGNVGGGSPQLQENINPALNRAPAPQHAAVGADVTPAPVFSSPVLEGLMHANGVNGTGFDGFADSNLFTLKMLDAYRMQLWTKMASQQAPGSNAFNLATHTAAHSSPSPSNSTHSSPSLSPVLSHHAHPHSHSHHHHHTPSPILQTISPALPSASPPSQVAPGPHLLSRTPPPLISSPSPFTTMALPGSGSGSSSSSSGGSGNNSPEWHYHSNNNSPPALYGLASNLRPSFFQASQKPLGSSSGSGSGTGSGNGSLSSLLAGKFGGRYNSHNHLGSHSSMASLTNSISNLSMKDSSSSSSARAAEKAKKDAETAVIATLASQTLLKRLGGAFWDAFSGHSTPGSTSAATIANVNGGPSSKTVDQEKVRKVLEGRAVVKVVDVEPSSQPQPQSASSRAPADCGALLEESFKSLTLGKK